MRNAECGMRNDEGGPARAMPDPPDLFRIPHSAFRIREAVARVPFEDHHVHQPLQRAHALTPAEFRRPFTEAALAAVWEERLGSHVAYRWLVRELAQLLDVAPDEAAVLAARNAMPERQYHRTLAESANFGACYADDLFDPEHSYGLEEWAALLGRPVHRLLRVEVFVE